MYVHHESQVPDRDTALDFIERYGFAALVGADLEAMHLPLSLDRNRSVLTRPHGPRESSVAIAGRDTGPRDLPRPGRLHLARVVRELARGTNLELRCCPRARNDAFARSR